MTIPTTPVPPEDASDLWGREPRPESLCKACGVLAEPYKWGRCWKCVANQEARKHLAARRPQLTSCQS